ncbi:MAG: DUF5702 domain-containing protein [Lachnospiraceae bacterium]|nr:DUF5702 domain-containing protein [Lachnospiraceae bacterium]
MKKQHPSQSGSITVYLALVFSVMVSLVYGLLLSVKVSAGRMQAANAADQSIYSLFAHFDRQAAEDFGLFFIWTGRSSGGPDPGACIRELEDASDYLLDPNKGRVFFKGSAVLKLQRESCAVTGYTLLTDAGGAPFRRQAEQAVKDTFGISALSRLQELAAGTKDTEEQGKQLLEASGKESFDQLQAEADEARKRREQEAEEAGTEVTEPAVPEGFSNPLPFLRQLMKEAVLDIAAPEGVSDKKTQSSLLVSGRTLSRGVGVINAECGSSDLYLKSFIHRNFSSYKKAAADTGLAYQKEYILCGKESDLENMKETVHRLMLMREAANIAGIYRDEVLSGILSKNASLIASVMGIPAASAAIKLLLASGWAYAESVVDIRALFMGKRVSLIKTSSSWQTGLDQIRNIRSGIDSLTKDTEGGLRYDDYLGMLLVASGDDLTMRTMDMLEMVLQGKDRGSFRLDSCMTALAAEMKVRSEGKVSFTVKTEMDYDTF